MNRLFVFAILVVLSTTSSTFAQQEIVSGIFGYNHFSLPGNSDTIVALPFARTAASSADVASASGNVITASGVPGWTASQFVYSAGVQSNTYYARFDSGALEGKWYDITANSTNTLTVNLNSDTLAAVVAGDKISIVPHWTLGTIFVNGNGVHQTTALTLGNPPTQVLIPNLITANKNLSPAATYYYFTNSGVVNWRLVGGGSANKDDQVVQPNTYLTIRHNVSTNTTFTSYGDVILTKVAMTLRVNSTNQVDNALGLPRPVSLTLNDSGLIASGAFVPTTSLASRKDDLIVFDNAATNKNKSAAATYYYYNSGWRKIGSPTTTDYGTSNVLVPGAGFIIRKSSGATVVLWTNTPTYTNQ